MNALRKENARYTVATVKLHVILICCGIGSTAVVTLIEH